MNKVVKFKAISDKRTCFQLTNQLTVTVLVYLNANVHVQTFLWDSAMQNNAWAAKL
jgi:hypothetical protein